MRKQLLILFFFLGFINTQDVEEVVVTSSLTDQTQIDNPVHVVSKEDLANDASVSLGEALDNLLGVSNADFGLAIGQPIIRGMSGSRVKVLSNGMVVRDVKPQYKTAMEESSTEGFMLVDMNVAKEFALSSDIGMTVSFFAKNLMDERARNHTSFVKNQVPLAGRNIGFKFNITF